MPVGVVCISHGGGDNTARTSISAARHVKARGLTRPGGVRESLCVEASEKSVFRRLREGVLVDLRLESKHAKMISSDLIDTD